MSNKNNILKRKVLTVGKVARQLDNVKSHVPRNCPVTLEVELRQTDKGIEFSMCATFWNHMKTDCFMAGQCCDEVVPLVWGHGKPADSSPEFKAKVERMVEVWSLYHLNGMKAGTIEQEKALIEWRGTQALHVVNFESTCNYLKSINLYEVEVDGKPYKYGSGWLLRQIPQDVIDEVLAW